MEFLDDPEEMTPEQRLSELAAILGAGYLRSRRSGPFTEKPLDCSGDERPCGVDGLTEREPVGVTP